MQSVDRVSPASAANRPAAIEGVVSVVASTMADLEELPDALASSGLAAVALELARALDDPDASATAKASCATAYLDCFEAIEALRPPVEQADALDDLSGRRAARREAS